jgi:hypothetical protein
LVVATCNVSNKKNLGFLGGVGYIGSVCFHSCTKVPNALELSVGLFGVCFRSSLLDIASCKAQARITETERQRE